MIKSPEEIGRIVRELRGDVSLREFAEKCDMSHTTIDNIEKGRDFRTGKPTQIKLVTLHKISHACGVPISYLTGEAEKNDEEDENNVVVLHRNGKKIRRKITDELMDEMEKMIIDLPEVPKNI